MEVLFKYNGVDWVAMISSMLSIYYLGKRKRVGFVFGLIGSLAWITFNTLVMSVAGVLANIVLIALNAKGYWQWGKENS